MKNNYLFSVSIIFILIFSGCSTLSTGNSRELTYVVVPVEYRPLVKSYVLDKTNVGLELMITSAGNNESVPKEMSFLIKIAKDLYGKSAPDKMDSRAVLNAFVTQREAFDVIETHYRNEVFRLFKNNSKEAAELFNTNDINPPAEKISENPKLTFHIVDEIATERFNNYYRANPAATFDARGILIDQYIVPADVMVLGVFGKDVYGLDVQQRNVDGSLRYLAVKKEAGLDGNYIQRVSVGRSQYEGRPIINVTLKKEGGEIFYQLTSANINRELAIIFDGKIRSHPIIAASIGGVFVISGFDMEESLRLAEMFKMGN